MLATGNRLLPLGNRLPESKILGKRFFFEKFSLTKLCYSIFKKKNSFYTYLNGSCISWVFSWFFTWILILDWMTLWFLKLAWILILDLSLWHHQNKLGSFASISSTSRTSQSLTDSYHALRMASSSSSVLYQSSHNHILVAVIDIDTSGIHAFEELYKTLQKRKIQVIN